ncbi:MAG: DUF3322 domain-containing protein [Myxococcota bacterium]
MTTSGKAWSTPEDLRAQVRRLWDSGQLLSARITGEALFPFRLKLKRPTHAELSSRFDDVRQWMRALEQGAGYRLEYAEVNLRPLGRNRVPQSAWIDDEETALRMLQRSSEASRFAEHAQATQQRFPTLQDWLARHPLVVVEHADAWGRILEVLTWFRANPLPGVYLRQVPVSGVDTKFVEQHSTLLAELLDQVLPPEAIRPEFKPARHFEQRYGLRPRPMLVRMRVLDERLSIGGLRDLAAPAAELARVQLAVRHVFITENEVTGISFPDAPESVVVFGLGYNVERIAEIPWLENAELHYWGDLDTHGFAILDRLRQRHPRARSFLMDRATLLSHRSQWVTEEEPHLAPLSRLTTEEHSLYADLVHNTLGPRVRLEQERVGYPHVVAAVRGLVPS